MFKVLTIVGILSFVVIACAVSEPGRNAPITITAEGKPGIIIKTGAPVYDEVYSLVGGAGYRTVTVEQWEEVNDLLKKWSDDQPPPSEVTIDISTGLDPNSANENGTTLLHDAANERRIADARILIEAGARVNARNNTGDTPLHNAAANGSYNGAPDIVRLLIESKADVNAVGLLGRTPLHMAVMLPGKNTQEVVRLLLDAGASEAIPDSDGKLPIDYARERMPELVSVFRNKDAAYKGVMAEKSSLDDWTLEEMTDCAGTVDKLREDAPTPEHANILLQSCKAAVFLKQIETSTAIRESLSSSERAAVMAHAETLDKINDAVERIKEDGVTDEQEANWVCAVTSQWTAQVNEADAYLDSLDRDDLQGIEIDVLRLASFTSGLDDTCAAGVSRAQSASTQVPSVISETVPTATIPPTPALDLAATVEASVHATVEARPTSTPEPTPPPDVESILRLGVTYAEAGEYDKAMAQFDKVIEYEPYRADAYMSRGHIFAVKGDLDRAITDYTAAIEKYPGNAEGYLSRAIAYWSIDDHDNAFLDFDKAIILSPLYAEAYLQRGGAYLTLVDYEKAIADFDRVIELNPEHAYVYYARGLAYAAYVQDYDRAIDDLNRSLVLEPDNADVYNSRGVLHEIKGDFDLAIADYKRALAIDPVHDEARKSLEAAERN